MSSPPTETEVQFAVPTTATETRTTLKHGPPRTTLVAGGQSLSLSLTPGQGQENKKPELLVDISSVPEYNGITVGEQRVEIGATTTYRELTAHGLTSVYPILEDAVSIIGDVQVRNRGTIGGAIGQADPAYDIIPPLLALGATVTIGSSTGQRLLPLADLFIDQSTTALSDHELIEAITFDPRTVGTGCYCSQATVKGGRSTVGVGVDIQLANTDPNAPPTVSQARVALGAVAPTPVRAPTAERILTETDLTSKTVQAAADAVTEDIDPVSDQYGSAQYKLELATVLTTRAITTAVTRAEGSVE